MEYVQGGFTVYAVCATFTSSNWQEVETKHTFQFTTKPLKNRITRVAIEVNVKCKTASPLMHVNFIATTCWIWESTWSKEKCSCSNEYVVILEGSNFKERRFKEITNQRQISTRGNSEINCLSAQFSHNQLQIR